MLSREVFIASFLADLIWNSVQTYCPFFSFDFVVNIMVEFTKQLRARL